LDILTFLTLKTLKFYLAQTDETVSGEYI